MPLANVTQVRIDEGGERVTFNKALRSVLRHDPDVVLVGEIRDEETADIAVRAALTGHLVLSTVHTNDAVGVVTRLLDLGLPEYLVAATVRLVMAQRLVRGRAPTRWSLRRPPKRSVSTWTAIRPIRRNCPARKGRRSTEAPAMPAAPPSMKWFPLIPRCAH